jgi:oligopeptidase B
MKNDTLPPRAEARPVQIETHGITRQDAYSWLRADNWQEVMKDPSVLNADIRAYLEAENTYHEA